MLLYLGLFRSCLKLCLLKYQIFSDSRNYIVVIRLFLHQFVYIFTAYWAALSRMVVSVGSEALSEKGDVLSQLSERTVSEAPGYIGRVL